MAETIAAISTPSGEGGIGIVRISGDRAQNIADKVFKSANGKTLADIGGYMALYGSAYDINGKIDEIVRIIGGDSQSETAKNHAVELIEIAKKYKLNN